MRLITLDEPEHAAVHLHYFVVEYLKGKMNIHPTHTPKLALVEIYDMPNAGAWKDIQQYITSSHQPNAEPGYWEIEQ